MIYLASRSPRRAQLLQQIGIEFKVVPADLQEKWDTHESPKEYVCRLALEKATLAHRRLGASINLPVLAADTAVVIGDQILNKPINKKRAREMLKQLSGKEHTVYTSVAIVADRQQVILNTSKVIMRDINDEEMDAYIETEEGLDKAGAYAVQGKAAIFISRINGSYSGIMGLPLFETTNLLQTFKVSIFSR